MAEGEVMAHNGERDSEGGPGRSGVPGDSLEKVRAFYDADAGYEWSRGERHRTEFAVTLRAIAGVLAAEATAGRLRAGPTRIIDIGGGPGRYSLALLEAGHRVTLLDLSPANVEHARRVTCGRLDGYHVGTATDLGGFPDGAFDVALLMGPLYHLLDETDRRRAVAEACRVLAPGGLLFASFITVYAPIRDMAKYDPESMRRHFPTPEAVVAWLDDGRWPAKGGSAFTDAYFAHPAAVRPFMESAGPLETIGLLAAEGVVSEIEDRINVLQGPIWDFWAEVNYRLASDPYVLGGAGHLLYVGRNRRSEP